MHNGHIKSPPVHAPDESFNTTQWLSKTVPKEGECDTGSEVDVSGIVRRLDPFETFTLTPVRVHWDGTVTHMIMRRAVCDTDHMDLVQSTFDGNGFTTLRPEDRALRTLALMVVKMAAIVRGVCCKLHPSGVVHYDIKPANVVIDHDGSLRLIDFGSATALEYESPDEALSDRYYYNSWCPPEVGTMTKAPITTAHMERWIQMANEVNDYAARPVLSMDMFPHGRKPKMGSCLSKHKPLMTDGYDLTHVDRYSLCLTVIYWILQLEVPRSEYLEKLLDFLQAAVAYDWHARPTATDYLLQWQAIEQTSLDVLKTILVPAVV